MKKKNDITCLLMTIYDTTQWICYVTVYAVSLPKYLTWTQAWGNSQTCLWSISWNIVLDDWLRLQKYHCRTSLVVQWLRTRLPIQRTGVRSPVWGYALDQLGPCATTIEPTCCNQWSLRTMEPVLCHRETTTMRNPLQLVSSPRSPQLEKSLQSNEDPAQPKINKY